MIRAVTKDGEEELRFNDIESDYHDDLGLRSRDLFYISYKNKLEEPGIVANITTKKTI